MAPKLLYFVLKKELINFMAPRFLKNTCTDWNTELTASIILLFSDLGAPLNAPYLIVNKDLEK